MIKEIKLQPDWRVYLIPFIIGFILIPLFGIGLLVLWFYWRKWHTTTYLVRDSEIIFREQSKHDRIPVQDIISCKAISDRILKRFNLGTIHIRTETKSRLILGQPQADQLASYIAQAAESEQERRKIEENIKNVLPSHPVGTLENKNDLVALWQQGLIREEDYQREMKKFE